jgi:hypothetical protein
VHDASNDLLTLLDCHERRGSIAMEDLGVISKMNGIAVHVPTFELSRSPAFK